MVNCAGRVSLPNFENPVPLPLVSSMLPTYSKGNHLLVHDNGWGLVSHDGFKYLAKLQIFCESFVLRYACLGI